MIGSLTLLPFRSIRLSVHLPITTRLLITRAVAIREKRKQTGVSLPSKSRQFVLSSAIAGTVQALTALYEKLGMIPS
jgi:hypothetical protein